MKSKLGAHIDIVTYPGQIDKIIQSGMKVVKVIHTMEALQQIYAAHGDKVTLIARSWDVGDNFLGFGGHLNPKAKAAEWFSRMLPTIQKAPFAYWESFNEMDNWNYLSHYGEFEAERQRIMAESGYRCCIGNFAVGGPPIVDPNDVWPKFYPALEAAHRYKNILGLHEYGALWMDTYYGPNSLQRLQAGQRIPFPESYEEGWLFGLYRKVWNKHIKPNGWTDTRIAITEMGLMSAAPAEINALVGYPVGSWRTCFEAWARLSGRNDPEQFYFEQLQWVDRQFQKDPYVVGGTIFTWGTFPESAWMKDEIQGPVADKLINYISSTVDTPEPENKSMHVTGIDISKHNGDFNFVKAYEDGHRFVFLRYSVGTEKDPSFDANLSKAHNAGLLVGAYHYMWAGGDISSQISLFTGLDPNLLDLPMVVDVENTAITEDNLKVFLKEIERVTGRIPMIYTRKNIIEVVSGTSPKDWLKRYRLWVAQYPAVVGEYPTEMPIHWSNWEFWQYTEEGRVTDHAGNVDINFFNGSLEDLKCRYAYPKPEFVWPVDSSQVTQPFGNNPAYYGPLIGAPGLGHEGIDFRAPTGANIYACADGIVKAVITTEAYGINVRVDHQNGLETIYAHLQQSLVSVGQRVFAGQKIALADNTGNSSGSHLHLTVKLEHATATGLTAYPNDIINPTSFLKYPVPSAVKMRMIYTQDINIRAEATINSDDIGDVLVNEVVDAYPPVVNEYLKITVRGITGYALAKHFQPIVEQTIKLRSIATPYVNIRSGPATSYSILGTLPYGAEITGYPVQENGFYKVIYNGAAAWVSAQWVEVVP